MLSAPPSNSPRSFQFRKELAISILIYALFAAAVFVTMGSEPLLGSDHLSYMRLADSIANAHPDGNYFSAFNSVQSFSALLAWLQPLTHSHVRSMKIILAVVSLPYLLAAELLVSLFVATLWKRRLFAILSGFAVSFGVASWGVTDSTALMPRTLVVPGMLFCVWFYLRFFSTTARYAVYPVLAVLSVFHLSTFYLLGIFLIFEVVDFLFIRCRKIDRRLVAFPAWMVVTFLLMFAMEQSGISVGSTRFLGSMIFPGKKAAEAKATVADSERRTGELTTKIDMAKVEKKIAAEISSAATSSRPQSAGDSVATTSTAKPAEAEAITVIESMPAPTGPRAAWAYELKTRPWRNMPLPWINLANILSSFVFILLLGLAGAWIAFRQGARELDVLMGWLAVSVVLFAFGPQTVLWILRQFCAISSINIEEIRSLSFLMIPALYFFVRLFDQLSELSPLKALWARPAVVALFLALPLTMKSLPFSAREKILGLLTYTGVVDKNPSSLTNARSALGLTDTVPLYYPVQGVTVWLQQKGAYGSLVLTERDDILAPHFFFVGSRQEVALQNFGSTHAKLVLYVHTRLKRAFTEHDLTGAITLGREIKARYLVVPWPVKNAAYRDANFSVIDLQSARAAAK